MGKNVCKELGYRRPDKDEICSEMHGDLHREATGMQQAAKNSQNVKGEEKGLGTQAEENGTSVGVE